MAQTRAYLRSSINDTHKPELVLAHLNRVLFDDLERHRVDVVWRNQGNRNPFIDHPEWVDCLFNDNCGGGDTTPPAAPTGLGAVAGTGTVDLDALTGVEAIVNLAGAGIGDRRWTSAYKRTLYDSHVGSARVLARAAAELCPAVSTLVSVGAMGYYGNDTGGTRLVEDSPAGDDFAARIIVDKERATEPAAEAGVRVVLPRLSLVMGTGGGTLGRRLLPLAKVGLLGPLAGGGSVWSVVSVQDTARAVLFLLENRAKGEAWASVLGIT